ncbi:MAG: class I SAM-dependent methyltransferase [Luteimonas sp.]
MTDYAQVFQGLYATDDPYGFRDRWYEQRKRALLLGSLRHKRYARAWELGCSNGELTAELAERCGVVYATDLSPRAVELARERNAQRSNVQISQAVHPEQWPLGQFELIVFSEVGFYLSQDRLADVVGKLTATLTTDGLLVAAHWTRPFPEGSMSGAAVHAAIREITNLPCVFKYEDGDFLLEGWSTEALTIAEQEGIA